MKTYSNLLLGLSVGVFISCGSTPQAVPAQKNPSDWLTTYKTDYPKSQYLYYLGEAPYQTVAENNAKKGIAEMFSTRIQAETNSTEKTFEEGQTFRQSYASTSKVKTTSDLEIKNLQLSESFHDKQKGIYYTLATLHKMETAQIYESEIQALYNQIDQLYTTYKQNQDILAQLAMISKAIGHYDEAGLLIPIHTVLNNGLGVLRQPQVTKAVLAKTQFELLNTITIYLDTSSFDDEKLSNMVQKQLNALGFKLQDAEENAMLSIQGSLNLEESSVENKDAKIINWFANVEIFDLRATKKQMGKYQSKGRASQLNYEAAKERAYFKLDKKINSDFSQFLISKLLNL